MAPSNTISGPEAETLLLSPQGIDVDSADNIYVANTPGDILEYASGSSGPASPTGAISGSNTGLNIPRGIALNPQATPTTTTSPTPTVTATATTTETASASATATATATATETPTATATATTTATATPTVTATLTATPTKTPKPKKHKKTPTPTPTPTATPVPESLNMNPLSYDFGEVKVGHKKSKTFTLSNSAPEGQPPITFHSSAAFSVPPATPQVFGFAGSATNCPRQLLPQKTCTVTVEFIPAKPKFYPSALTIDDNAANADQRITLSGSDRK
jgi:hypothetical protein